MTRRPLAELWGHGAGPLRLASPPARLVIGALLFAGLLAAPGGRACGWACSAAVGAAALAWARPPRRAVAHVFALGLLLFGPGLLLTPWVPVPETLSPALAPLGALAVPLRVLLKGLAGLLVSLSVVSALPLSEFHAALEGLPLPRCVVALCGQLVHQSGALLDETARITDALAVRGATRRGAGRLLLARGLPEVWLGRQIARAGRLADAMELRGLGPGSVPVRQGRWTRGDLAPILCAASILAVASALHLGELP